MPVLARLWPDTLVGRTVVVVAVGVVASNLAALALLSFAWLGVVTEDRVRQIAERVSAARDVVENAASADRRRVIRTLRSPGLRLAWAPEPWLQSTRDEARTRALRSALSPAPSAAPTGGGQQLYLRVFGLGEARSWVKDRRGGASWGGMRRHGHDMLAQDRRIEILAGSLQLSDRSFLNFAAILPGLPPLWTRSFAIIAVLTTVVAVALSAWAVRRASQPLSVLAGAAERLGTDFRAEPMAVRGPREVRSAALAFNGMQSRLQRFVEDRTQMLAAISHDLRTPLTRMRLRAELIEAEEDRGKMAADIEEMEAMIAAALSFLRDEAAEEPQERFDLAAMAADVCRQAREAGAHVRYLGPDHLPFLGGLLGLKRAVSNLVDNAMKYGSAVQVSVETREGSVLISVEDNGPGLPEADLQRVFEPFVRIDPSRNRQTGGVGLGLTVVRTVARSHGGDAELANMAAGGLRATLSLPYRGGDAMGNGGGSGL